MDYRQFYNLEPYLLNVVRGRFQDQGWLSAFDFFCIVIWKANRAKSKIATKLLNKGYPDLDAAARALTEGLNGGAKPRERLRYLMKDWGLGLAMASAILTILYPDEFTVYDVRVCNMLGGFHNLKSRTNFDNLWTGYIDFKRAVITKGPRNLTLRHKDRFLWGKSFHDQLKKDIREKFQRKSKPTSRS